MSTQHVANLLPYALLAPGLLWLAGLLRRAAVLHGGDLAEEGTLETGYQLTWHFETYTDAISNYQDQFLRSFEYAGLSTLIALVIAFPLAYVIAFRGGRYKNALLLRRDPAVLHHLPGEDAVLADDPRRLRLDRELPARRSGCSATTAACSPPRTAVVAGITYNYLPFMILPLYAALERIDPRMLEAGYDLYGKRRDVIMRVVVPLRRCRASWPACCSRSSRRPATS